MSAGQLQIRACYQAQSLNNLQVHLQRPPVAQLLPGMVPEQALATVPLLYALCNQAQTRAAAAALAAARAMPLPTCDSRALWLETLHEHLWRLLLDWPVALGLEAPREAFAVWRKCRQAAPAAFHASTGQLLKHTLGIASSTGTFAPALVLQGDGLADRCLARLGDPHTCLAQALADMDSAAEPDPQPWLSAWLGEADHPSGPELALPIATAPSPGVAYARRLRHTLIAWQALAEQTPYPVAAAGTPGVGVGVTQTTRGLLAHGVKLDASGNRITHYQVWAPTDRLFADAQPLARQLHGGTWSDPRSARQALETAILALDPCVPYTVDWLEN